MLQHYKGEIGEFDYDDEMYHISDNNYLRFNSDYVGPIDLPKGVKNLSGLFTKCNIKEGCYLREFDTSEVENMEGMFNECSIPEKFILGNNFNTSNVKNMRYMFCDAELPKDFVLGDKFNTSNVENMSHMFNGCHASENFHFGNGFSMRSVTNSVDMFKDFHCDLKRNNVKVDNFIDSLKQNNPDRFVALYENFKNDIIIPFDNKTGVRRYCVPDKDKNDYKDYVAFPNDVFTKSKDKYRLCIQCDNLHDIENDERKRNENNPLIVSNGSSYMLFISNKKTYPCYTLNNNHMSLISDKYNGKFKDISVKDIYQQYKAYKERTSDIIFEDDYFANGNRKNWNSVEWYNDKVRQNFKTKREADKLANRTERQYKERFTYSIDIAKGCVHTLDKNANKYFVSIPVLAKDEQKMSFLNFEVGSNLQGNAYLDMNSVSNMDSHCKLYLDSNVEFTNYAWCGANDFITTDEKFTAAEISTMYENGKVERLRMSVEKNNEKLNRAYFSNVEERYVKSRVDKKTGKEYYLVTLPIQSEDARYKHINTLTFRALPENVKKSQDTGKMSFSFNYDDNFVAWINGDYANRNKHLFASDVMKVYESDILHQLTLSKDGKSVMLGDRVYSTAEYLVGGTQGYMQHFHTKDGVVERHIAPHMAYRRKLIGDSLNAENEIANKEVFGNDNKTVIVTRIKGKDNRVKGEANRIVGENNRIVGNGARPIPTDSISAETSFSAFEDTY